jgi:hypothetical protein
MTDFPSLTPGSTTYINPSDQIELGMMFSVTAEVDIDGIYVIAPANSADAIVSLYELGAGSPLYRDTDVDLVTGRNEVEFGSPITLETGATYVAAVWYAHAAYSYVGTSSPHTETGFVGGDEDGSPDTIGVYKTGVGTALTTPVSVGSWTAPIGNYYGIGVFTGSAPVDPMNVTATTPVTKVLGQTANLHAEVTDEVGTVTFAWTQLTGDTVTITDDDTADAAVTPEEAGEYTFRVTATDDNGSDTADVTLTIIEPVETGGDEPHVFRPESYGALGDGVTDDTAAIQACIDDAILAAPANNYNVTVKFMSKVYVVDTEAEIGREFGNAMLSIPFIHAIESPKITLTFEGAGDNAQFIYWAQGEEYSQGTVIKSTWNPTTLLDTDENNVGYGPPAVLGGPTNLSSFTGETFKVLSAMHVVVDGVAIQVPHNSYLEGFNFFKMASARIKSAMTISDRTYDSDPAMQTLPSHVFSYGLVMPDTGNNARSQIDVFVAEGVSTAVLGGEHFYAEYLGVVFCGKGLLLKGDTYATTWPIDGEYRASTHSAYVGRMLCEGVEDWIVNYGDFNGDLVVSQLDGEGVTNFAHHIVDTNNLFTGAVHMNDIFQREPVVSGGDKLAVYNAGVERGAKTAPSVPTSAVAFQNPFWRDAAVYIHGGTVTAIEVDGLVTGLTQGMVIVPTGKSIRLTYSATPTWGWVVL